MIRIVETGASKKGNNVWLALWANTGGVCIIIITTITITCHQFTSYHGESQTHSTTIFLIKYLIRKLLSSYSRPTKLQPLLTVSLSAHKFRRGLWLVEPWLWKCCNMKIKWPGLDFRLVTLGLIKLTMIITSIVFTF